MSIEEIKTPKDILDFMNEHIKYGWLDISNEIHWGNMENFRRLYRTASIDECLKNGLGICIEQVYLMHLLFDKLGIKNKMFCTRIYEDENFNDLNAHEHMHCFVLYYLDGQVIQLEHPNVDRINFYYYSNEEEAVADINKYYIDMSGGIPRPVTEFFDVKPNLSFKEFNCYINSLGEYDFTMECNIKKEKEKVI